MNPITAAKLVGVLIVAGFLAWCVQTVNSWRVQAAKVPVLEQVMDQMRRGQERAREVSRDYQKQLADLRATRPAAPVVRMCRPAVPAPADHAGGRGHSGEGDGVLPRADGRDYREGPDIGADLTEYADEAEAVNLALQACLKAAKP